MGNIALIVIGMLCYRLFFIPLKQEDAVMHEGEMLLESLSATNQVNSYSYYYYFYYQNPTYEVLIVPLKQGVSTYKQKLNPSDAARPLKRKWKDATLEKDLAMPPCKKGIYVYAYSTQLLLDFFLWFS